MEKTYKITLRDIYGGDGFIRYVEMEEQVLNRTKKTKRTRSDIGVSIENGMTEIASRKSQKEVNTFRQEDGKPVLRLGGMHGKFWGAMKEARRALYSLGKSEYRSQSLIDMIQIDPIWVKLNTDGNGMTLEKLPQILNTMGKNTMIIQFYDCIPEATINLTLRYPDELDNVVNGLLEQVQHMGILNKRRTTIKSIKLLK